MFHFAVFRNSYRFIFVFHIFVKMRDSRDILVLICSTLWLAAGFNVVRMGVVAQKASLMGTAITAVGIAVVFILFAVMFLKISIKNMKRIRTLTQEKLKAWNCMPLKSFIIMAGMITLGVMLRKNDGVPRGCIASFYIGLGSALTLAGMFYLYHVVKGAFPKH